jgi:hypothetical protein
MARSTLTVEVEPGSDPITGQVTDRRGTRPFSGWLELAAVLQAAFDGDGTDDLRTRPFPPIP